jgi:hypothetical protein
VRDDLLGSLRPYSPEEAYVKAAFRESRNEQGSPTYLPFEQRLKAIASMPVWDLDSMRLIRVEELADADPHPAAVCPAR